MDGLVGNCEVDKLARAEACLKNSSNSNDFVSLVDLKVDFVILWIIHARPTPHDVSLSGLDFEVVDVGNALDADSQEGFVTLEVN